MGLPLAHILGAPRGGNRECSEAFGPSLRLHPQLSAVSDLP